MKRAPGFTLIEVLVALAIVAVALSAGMRALAQGADGASTLVAEAGLASVCWFFALAEGPWYI